MTSTYEAWSSGRPIFSRLPYQGYQQEEYPASDWLTLYFDSLLIETKAKLDDLPRQVNPLTCDIEWLDYLAPLCSFTDDYWDRNWTVKAKRILLSSADYIWRNKGTQECLAFVFDAFDLKAQIVIEGAFIIGSSAVGEDLGLNPWEYAVYMPSAYAYETEERLIRRLDDLFSPVYCKTHFYYDDSRFVVRELLQIADNTVLSPDSNSNQIFSLN